MKRLRITTLLLLSLTLSTLSFAQWKDISPTGGNPDDYIYDLQFFDENHGIAVGENPGTYEGLVFTTTNGGVNWTKKSYPNSSWKTIHFTDAQNGIIAGRYSDNGGSMTTQILQTSDGGKTWKLVTGKDNGILAVSFVNEKVGYSIGGGKSQGENGVQKTIDGGKTWNMVWNTYGWFLTSIWFVDENVGFVAGSSFSGGFSSVLAKTTDGGKTFSEISGYTNESSASGLYFVNTDVGYVLDRTTSSTRKLSKTTDQGKTWTKVADVDKDAHLLQFIGENDAFAAGGNGEIYKSTDAGKTWNPMTATGYYKTIRNVKVYGKHIYIMGQDPFIMRTEHGAADVDYVGVEESSLASAERVKVYPNPIQSNGVLTIDGVENEDSELILFNAVGKVVLNTSLKGNQVELSEFDLTDGVYFYRLTSASSSVSGKLVIK